MVFREKCTVLNRFIRLQIKLACKLRSLGNSKTKKKMYLQTKNKKDENNTRKSKGRN